MVGEGQLKKIKNEQADNQRGSQEKALRTTNQTQMRDAKQPTKTTRACRKEMMNVNGTGGATTPAMDGAEHRMITGLTNVTCYRRGGGGGTRRPGRGGGAARPAGDCLGEEAVPPDREGRAGGSRVLRGGTAGAWRAGGWPDPWRAGTGGGERARTGASSAVGEAED